MANREQLEVFAQGVEAWNKWRKENPDVLIDLKGANLRHKNLENVNLAHAELDSANLSFADFKRANLAFARFGSIISLAIHCISQSYIYKGR